MATLRPEHKEFLLQEAHSLLNFARGSAIDTGGFGYLTVDGKVDPSKPLECYMQARKIQVFGLSHQMGLADCKELVVHGVQSLSNLFRDKKNGGFYSAVSADGAVVSDRKLAYDHMFVLLGATTAIELGISGAQELFDQAQAAIEKYFWDPEFSMMRNDWSQDFSSLDSYRGINPNACCGSHDSCL
jgi:mannose/cellobiose epimerase-like protein (N-acyl-D-glucosamine 2-epimerase family)